MHVVKAPCPYWLRVKSSVGLRNVTFSHVDNYVVDKPFYI